MRIAGFGTALPQHSIAQSEAATISKAFARLEEGQERLFEALYRRSGVERRYSVILERSEGPLAARQNFYGDQAPTTAQRMRKYESEATKLAVASSTLALEQARTDARDVTHLVTISCSGFHAPGFDIALAKQLPLRGDIARTHIGFMGCQGALNGLRVAQAFTAADPNACVLVCATELCSLHHQYGWEPEAIVANALFADGSAAIIGFADSSETRDIHLPKLIATGSILVPDSEDAMSWRIGDHGFMMTLSSRVPSLIAQNLRPWLDQWLAKYEHSVASIGSWAIHPGGPRILSAFGETVEIAPSALKTSYDVLAQHGNMSSPTVVFIMDRLHQANAPRPWVAMAFGPGLTVEVALII